MKRANLHGVVALGLVAVLTAAGCGQAGDSDVATAATGGEAAPRAPAPRPSAPAMLSVPDGTLMDVQLATSLNSGVSLAGDRFSAEVLEAVVVEGREAIPAGSTVRGSVTEVKKAKRGAGNASMTLAFTQIELPGGYTTSLVASLSEQSESKKGRNAGIIGGSAAGGALLGRIIGKDTKGAVVGSIVGGAIGTGVVLSKEGEQVNLPAGTELTIRLDQSVKVPR